MNIRALPALAALFAFSATASAHFVDGQLYYLDQENDRAWFVNPDTLAVVPMPQQTFFADVPGSLAFTIEGKMLMANYGNDQIHEFDGDGGTAVVLTAADGITGINGAGAIAIGPGVGDIFIADLDGAEILRFDRNYVGLGVFADSSDGLIEPRAIAVDSEGNLLVADSGAAAVFKIDAVTGVATTFDSYVMELPIDVLVRNNKDVYVLTDRGNIHRYAGGDPVQASLIGSYAFGQASMTFSSDYAHIFHVNINDKWLRRIDPDTGASVNVIQLSGKPNVIAAIGSQFAHGTWGQVPGHAQAGTGGVKPTLSAVGDPLVGQSTTVEVKDVVGGAPVVVGFSQGTDFSTLFGAEFCLDLTTPFYIFDPFVASGTPGVAGDGSVTLNFLIPNNPALFGATYYWQAGAIDAGAAQGLSITKCLHMYIGE